MLAAQPGPRIHHEFRSPRSPQSPAPGSHTPQSVARHGGSAWIRSPGKSTRPQRQRCGVVRGRDKIFVEAAVGRSDDVLRRSVEVGPAYQEVQPRGRVRVVLRMVQRPFFSADGVEGCGQLLHIGSQVFDRQEALETCPTMLLRIERFQRHRSWRCPTRHPLPPGMARVPFGRVERSLPGPPPETGAQCLLRRGASCVAHRHIAQHMRPRLPGRPQSP